MLGQCFRVLGSSVRASDSASASQEAPSERRTGLPRPRKLRQSIGQCFRVPGSSVRVSDKASFSQEAPSELYFQMIHHHAGLSTSFFHILGTGQQHCHTTMTIDRRLTKQTQLRVGLFQDMLQITKA